MFVAAACSEDHAYLYRPAVQANAQASGLPAAHYSIPPTEPKGDVRVASMGVTEIQEQGGGGQKVKVLHVRMIVANNSDETPWTVDTRNVQITIGPEGRSRPAFVNTDGGAPPVVQVARGEQRTVDLFYPLPTNVDTPEKVPAFDVLWGIETTAGPIAERTPFERQQIEPAYAYDGYYPYGYLAVGFAPYWWFDPFFVNFTFVHHPHVFVPHAHGAFVVAHPHGFQGGGFHGGYNVAAHGGVHGGGYHGGGYHGGGFHGGGAPHGGHR